MRHDRRYFGRLDQEDQRLKKHYGRWMDIIRSLELESFILTKLTKPSHQVGSQLAGGVFIFLCVIRRHFRWVRADSGGNVFCEIRWSVRWVPAVRGKCFFAKYGGPSGRSQQSGGKRFFREILVARPVGPCCQVEE